MRPFRYSAGRVT